MQPPRLVKILSTTEGGVLQIIYIRPGIGFTDLSRREKKKENIAGLEGTLDHQE